MSHVLRRCFTYKSCRTTLELTGKSYIATNHAGTALHTMVVLQAYQADIFKDMADPDLRKEGKLVFKDPLPFAKKSHRGRESPDFTLKTSAEEE